MKRNPSAERFLQPPTLTRSFYVNFLDAEGNKKGESWTLERLLMKAREKKHKNIQMRSWSPGIKIYMKFRIIKFKQKNYQNPKTTAPGKLFNVSEYEEP